MVEQPPEQLLPTSRRDFLKNAAVAAVGAPLLFSPYVQRRSYSCIIIGAGLSGLAAAYALKNWNVTVLEARPRIGGRIISFNFKENPELACELGGEWVGASHDRMKALCHDFNIPLRDHRFEASISHRRQSPLLKSFARLTNVTPNEIACDWINTTGGPG